MDSNELTQVPANANPADYNRIERFVLVTTWIGGSTTRGRLSAKTVADAKVEAGEARTVLSTLPTFDSCKLVREVRYVYEPYCAAKHDAAQAWM